MSTKHTTEGPRYGHDCRRCIHLGGTEFEGTWYDLYACDQGVRVPTFIARYGSEGPAYTSGLPGDVQGWASDHPIHTAVRLLVLGAFDRAQQAAEVINDR
jgi:hypothetical protein